MLGNFVWIDGIVVKNEFRNKGIGNALIKKFKQIIRKKGIAHIYLTAPKSNINTIKFYASVGMNKGNEFIEFSGDI